MSQSDGSIPPAGHCVFNLERLDATSCARAARACENGARVTFILKHIDAATARFLAAETWNVLPAYGDGEHIGAATLQRALRMACAGVHVVARGFLKNSGHCALHPTVHPFVRLAHRMSELAKGGEAVVAAVLAPPHSGSQFLRDLIGWTVGSAVRVVHEHRVPSATDPWAASGRRYIFLAHRDPVDRLVSYFIKRHSRFLRERIDAATQTFVDSAEIQHVFDMWLPEQVERHNRWFRTNLLHHFGVDVYRAKPTDEGWLVVRRPPKTLFVIPTEMLTVLQDVVDTEYGADTCAPLADNSAADQGVGAINGAFRRDIRFPDAVATALRSIREVAHIREHTDPGPDP